MSHSTYKNKLIYFAWCSICVIFANINNTLMNIYY